MKNWTCHVQWINQRDDYFICFNPTKEKNEWWYVVRRCSRHKLIINVVNRSACRRDRRKEKHKRTLCHLDWQERERWRREKEHVDRRGERKKMNRFCGFISRLSADKNLYLDSFSFSILTGKLCKESKAEKNSLARAYEGYNSCQYRCDRMDK